MFNNESDSLIINKLKNSLNIPINTNTNTDTTTNNFTNNTNSTNIKENKKFGVGYKKKFKVSSDKLKLLNQIHQSNFKTRNKSNRTNEKKENNRTNEKKENMTRLDLIFNNNQ